MKFNTIFLFVIFILSLSCSENKQVAEEVRTIHLKETNDILPISSFVKNVDYLELKFPDSNIYTGEIYGMKILGNDIIVTQRKGRELNFLRFSKDGNYKNEITRNGMTHNVIVEPKDIIEYKNDFAVWDQSGIQIISKTGKYKSKLFDPASTGNRFFYSKSKFFFFQETISPGFLARYSENGKLEKLFSPNEKQTSSIAFSYVSVVGKDNYHLFSTLNDTVFTLAENTLIPEYILNADPYPTLMQVLENVGERNERETKRYINNKKYVVVKNYLENKNFIFITYWLGSKSINLIIKKSNWETTYFVEGINDIDGGIWRKPVYLSDDDVLYIPISAYKIASHKIVNEKRKDFQNIKDKIGESSNPVLLRCKLK